MTAKAQSCTNFCPPLATRAKFATRRNLSPDRTSQVG